jgi:hypothetical protein
MADNASKKLTDAQSIDLAAAFDLACHPNEGLP